MNRVVIPTLAGAATFYLVRKARRRSVQWVDVDRELLARARPIPDKIERDEERNGRAQRRQKRREAYGSAPPAELRSRGG